MHRHLGIGAIGLMAARARGVLASRLQATARSYLLLDKFE
jgi:hypothetical protein